MDFGKTNIYPFELVKEHNLYKEFEIDCNKRKLTFILRMRSGFATCRFLDKETKSNMLTGDGDAIRVLSTISYLFNEILTTYNLKYVVFSASTADGGTKRQRIYEAILLKNLVEGYAIVRKDKYFLIYKESEKLISIDRIVELYKLTKIRQNEERCVDTFHH